MSKFPTFEIELNSVGHKGKVLMDGQELKGITGVMVESTASGISRVSLDFIPEQLLIRVNDADVVKRIHQIPDADEPFSAMGERFKVYARQPKPEPIVERISGVGSEDLEKAIAGE